MGQGKDTVGMRSGTLLTGAFALLVSFLSMAVYAHPDIQQDKICLRENGKGKCLGYRLPYRGYSINDYVLDMESRMSKRQIAAAQDLLRGDSGRLDEQVVDKLRSLKAQRSKLRSEEAEKLKPATEVSEEVKIYTYAVLKEMNGKQQNILDHTRLAADDIHRLAHALYCQANKIHLEVSPDFKPLTNNDSISAIGYQKERSIGIAQEHGDNSAQLQRIGGWILILNKLYNFYHQWTSLETTDWIIENVPEIKAAPVLELGAGSGYQALLLKMREVKVLATDITPDFPRYTHVERISAALAIRRYDPEKNIFLVQYPDNAMMASILEVLDRRPGPWILIVVSRDPDELVSKIWFEKASISVAVAYHNSALAEAAHLYQEKKTNGLTVFRRISDPPLGYEDQHTDL